VAKNVCVAEMIVLQNKGRLDGTEMPDYDLRRLPGSITMFFYADLHVHSRYSRATSRDADLEHLALWARRKGITVVGTGDFTHPAWFEEIRTKLLPAEPGLFRLRPEIEREVERQLPASCHGPTRFLLEVEISTIYKKAVGEDDRTRKVHHLIYASNLDTAARIRERLGTIGNLASDGRPILGLDSRHLLEITLESGPDAYLVPAHVWTPWFAVLGSKSGFDSVEDCYGDLTPHIFAVETGLSSDPPMNWRVSCLDRFTLVSNSDAHSPPMLGREACSFDTDLDYFAIRRALETGEGYGGTVEFFPEEGKYHLDGHRACGVRLEPTETREVRGLCPSCGKPLTVGVMHRVEELADRLEVIPEARRTDPFRSLVPLPEIVAEIRGTGVKSQGVERTVAKLVAKLGPEIGILERVPVEEVGRAGEPLLAEALERLRAGQVRRESGYDGEYGVIRLFEPGEIRGRSVVAPLFDPVPPLPVPLPRSGGEGAAAHPHTTQVSPSPGEGVLGWSGRGGRGVRAHDLDPDQKAAVEAPDGALLVVAGPGTGKTRTLTHRIAHLVSARGVDPRQCLAVTFSRRAAAEMQERLSALIPEAVGRMLVSTFHGLGLTLIQELAEEAGLPPGFRVATSAERADVVRRLFGVSSNKADRALEEIGQYRRFRKGLNPERARERAAAYEQELLRRNLLDFDDLLLRPLFLLRVRSDLVARYRERFRWIFIDEYQDVDPLQYELIRLLCPPDGNLCAIGDPDQSIYRFRGADVGFFLRFKRDWLAARVVHLTRNYRSTRTVVEAACEAIRPASLVPDRQLVAVSGRGGPEDRDDRIVVASAATEKAEAELVVKTLERLLGGTSSFSFDSGRVGYGDIPNYSFADVAILYRTETQTPPLVEALARAGIPFQKRSHRPLVDQPGISRLIKALRKRAAAGSSGSVESVLDQVASEGERPVAELLRPLAARSGDDLERFLTEVGLGAEVDTWDPRAEGVSLLTLHASKGLEFPIVFLVGCENGLLPMIWPESADSGEDLAEERRLFFVGITRARLKLFLFHSRKRTLRGETAAAQPSPFLADLPDRLLERREEEQPYRPRQAVQLRLI
jgi:DNA helicase II / ATP-dependent DNA helicase PcrA